MKKKLLTMFLTLILCCTALVGLAGCTSAGNKFVVTTGSARTEKVTTENGTEVDCYNFTKGNTIEQTLNGWTFYYPAEENFKGESLALIADDGKNGVDFTTATTRNSEYKMSYYGYDVKTLTEPKTYRTLTFIYSGQTFKINYIVTANGSNTQNNNNTQNNGGQA